MAANIIEICNKALLQVSASKITNLTDNTSEADACEFLYDDTRRELLRQYDWPFAIAQAALVETSADVTGYGDWTYQYDLPSDWLRTLRVSPDGELSDATATLGPTTDPADKWFIYQTYLQCDVEDAWIQYIKDEADTTTFPADFERTLILALASKLAMPLTGDPQVADNLNRQYQIAYAEARASSADAPHTIPPEGDWLAARS